MVKAKSIGSGLGAFFNNPGVIILGALAVVLLFFRGDIRNAFGSLGESIAGGVGAIGDINIQLPEFTLPDIKFPDFNIDFPSFDFGGIFGGDGGQFPNLPPGGEEGILVTQPGEPGLNPADMPTAPSPVDILLGEGETDPRKINPEAFDPELAPQLFDPTLFQPPTAEIPLEAPMAPISQLNLGGFQGEAISAPLGALPLSQIIERFMVTASQAANIRFIAQQGGDPFAEPSNIFGENPPAVSDPQFQGLSLEEIALRLTGGNISNF